MNNNSEMKTPEEGSNSKKKNKSKIIIICFVLIILSGAAAILMSAAWGKSPAEESGIEETVSVNEESIPESTQISGTVLVSQPSEEEKASSQQQSEKESAVSENENTQVESNGASSDYYEEESSDILPESSQEQKESLIHYTAVRYAETDRYGYSAADVNDRKCYARELLSSDEFSNAELTSTNFGKCNRLTCYTSIGCQSGDKIVLQFAAYCPSGASKLDINIGGIENRVSLTKEPYYFYIPVSGIYDIDKIVFTSHSDEDIYISDAFLVDYGNGYDIHDLTTGCFQIQDYSRVNIDADSAIAAKAKSAVVNGNYMYAISGTPEGCLSVYKLDGRGGAALVSKLDGLGDARDIEFNKDKSAVVITARRRGAHIVDISSPEHPVLCAEYDAVEYACGLCTEGDYAFICCRWFGVEVVDISDRYHPKYVCTLPGNGEYHGCFVNNGMLYVSAYNEKRVDVWDVHDLNHPVLKTQLYLDGAGQGLYADGNYLYAATALNSSNKASSVTDYGKGTGNGLEIFDIRDKNNIQWVSTVKFDGRFNINFQDVWDVEVSGGLAYVSCMCYGTVIIDVSDASCPKIRKELLIHADSDSRRYVNYNADSKIYVWSFDNERESYGAAFHTILTEGRLYIISSNMGIYTYSSNDIHPAVRNSKTNFTYTGRHISLPERSGWKIEHYGCDAQIWAVEKIGENYALACGSGGIRILNKNLKEIAKMPAEHPVRDIRVFGDLIYTAESSGGLGIYQWKEGKLISISHCVIDRKDICFGSVELTSDGEYAVVESSMVSHCVINVSDIYHPYELTEYREKSLGSTYYRTICIGLVKGKYVGIGGEKNITWYCSEDGVLSQIEPNKNIIYSRSNGMAAYGNSCIALYNGGYVLYDPETGSMSEVKSISGVYLEGKISVWGKTLVVSREYSDLISFVDISDIDHPKLITELHIDGNPDICTADGKSLLVPCRNGGLLRITVK